MTKNPIIIIGAGGFSKEVMGWLNHSDHTFIGFYTDNQAEPDQLCGMPVYKSLKDLKHVSFLVAVGDPETRKKLYDKAVENYLVPALPLFHQTVITGHAISIGRGSIICPGVILTSHIEIGVGVIVNIASTIGHDCKIGDFSTISPGANISGNVEIGENSYIGTGSCIREKINIGKNSVVGMGSVVVKDVPDCAKVMGNPARQPVMKPVAS